MMVIDIETSYQPEALGLPITEDDLNAGIGSHWKDPEKIAAKQAENRAAWTETLKKQACLDWRLGRIVAIGVLDGVNASVFSRWAETELLTAFWRQVQHTGRIVGFNCRSFDLPWLYGRSAALGVTPSRWWSESRYTSKVIVDWCDILSNYGGLRMNGWTLERYNTWFALGAPMHGSGADVPGWIDAGEWDEVERHLQGDLQATRALHTRFTGYLG